MCVSMICTSQVSALRVLVLDELSFPVNRPLSLRQGSCGGML